MILQIFKFSVLEKKAEIVKFIILQKVEKISKHSIISWLGCQITVIYLQKISGWMLWLINFWLLRKVQCVGVNLRIRKCVMTVSEVICMIQYYFL